MSRAHFYCTALTPQRVSPDTAPQRTAKYLHVLHRTRAAPHEKNYGSVYCNEPLHDFKRCCNGSEPLVLNLASGSLHQKNKKNCYFLFSLLSYPLSCKSASSTSEAPTGNRSKTLHQPLYRESKALPTRPSQLLLPHCKNPFLNHMLVTFGIASINSLL